MTEPAYSHRTLLYLLEEMSPAEREAYEAELKADPSLRAEIRDAGDDLAAWVEDAVAPVPPPAHLWSEIVATLPLPSSASGSSRWGSFVSSRLWPTAAALLLVGNLAWLTWWKWGQNDSSPTPPAAHENLAKITETAPMRTPASVDELRAALAQAEKQAEEWETTSAKLSERLTEVTADHRALQQELRNWVDAANLARSEQIRLQHRIGSFFAPLEGRANLTVIELHPSGSTTSGLVEEITDAIVETGDDLATNDTVKVVSSGGAIPDDARPGSPTGFHPGIISQTADTVTGYDNTPTIPETSDNPTTQQSTVAENSPSPNDDAVEPSALAIWRNDLQQGFMNLYGLPAATDGGQYHLWAREAGGNYVAVGILPDNSQGTVLLEFTVSMDAFMPDSFLLTEETSTEVTQPTGPVVLTSPGGGG